MCISRGQSCFRRSRMKKILHVICKIMIATVFVAILDGLKNSMLHSWMLNWYAFSSESNIADRVVAHSKSFTISELLLTAHPICINHSVETWKNSFTGNKGLITRYDCRLVTAIHTLAKSSSRFYANDFMFFNFVRNEHRWSKMARNPQSKLNSTSPTTNQFLGNISKNQDFSLKINDLLFIIMGSSVNAKKTQVLINTWLHWTSNNYFIFSDSESKHSRVFTLPELMNRATYSDAQHRQLRGAKWLFESNQNLVNNKEWFIFADDDTWINVPALLSYLSDYDSNLPIAIGFIWDGFYLPRWSFLAGGSGIVLSRTTFNLITPLLYTERCPFLHLNDLTISLCLFQAQILKIHSNRFNNIPVTLVPKSGLFYLLPPLYVSKVTYHYINSYDVALHMTCNAAHHWKSYLKICHGINTAKIQPIIANQMQ
jgi:Fringe-like